MGHQRSAFALKAVLITQRWVNSAPWHAIFEALAHCGNHGATLSVGSTSIKVHRLGERRKAGA